MVTQSLSSCLRTCRVVFFATRKFPRIFPSSLKRWAQCGAAGHAIAARTPEKKGEMEQKVALLEGDILPNQLAQHALAELRAAVLNLERETFAMGRPKLAGERTSLVDRFLPRTIANAAS